MNVNVVVNFCFIQGINLGCWDFLSLFILEKGNYEI